MGIDAQWEQMEDRRGRFEVTTRRMTSAVETQGSSKASRELRGSVRWPAAYQIRGEYARKLGEFSSREL